MLNEKQIDSRIKELFDDITFKDAPKGLYDPLRYMISIGGKRIRPRLCLTTYALYRDDLSDRSVTEPAVGIEVFHTFTLIHDDIMDKSRLRRGQETVWSKWGDDCAILSGDVMCIDSYRRISLAPVKILPQMIDLFARTAAQVCEGQQLDMDFEKEEGVSMDAYMEMIGLKTGVLIACSAKMGAMLGGAPEKDCDSLYDYGYSLGLAFQVADDYLDAFGDEKVFGKPIGGDIVNNKMCWLTTRALEKADDKTRSELLDALHMPVDTKEQKDAKIEKVKGIYTALEVDKDAKEEILRLNNEALQHARKVCSGVRYESLRRFADRLVGRTR